MRKFSFLWLLIPAFGLSQKQNTINASRFFPKVDKIIEFEKALLAHEQKYHNAEWKWKVYEIQTGPDAGGYQVNEGPKSWGEFDKRGSLGDEHQKDWNKNVAIYLTDKYSSIFADYREDLSTAQLGDFTDKIAITHVFPKAGYGNKVEETIRIAKKAWEAGDQTVAVYQSVASGPSQYALVFRMKNGLGELETGYRKSMKERYEATGGEGAFEAQLDRMRESTDNAWSELLFYRADLSAK